MSHTTARGPLGSTGSPSRSSPAEDRIPSTPLSSHFASPHQCGCRSHPFSFSLASLDRVPQRGSRLSDIPHDHSLPVPQKPCPPRDTHHNRIEPPPRRTHSANKSPPAARSWRPATQASAPPEHRLGCTRASPICVQPTQRLRCTSSLRTSTNRDRSPPAKHAGRPHHRRTHSAPLCWPSHYYFRHGLDTSLLGARGFRVSGNRCWWRPHWPGEGAVAPAHAGGAAPHATRPTRPTERASDASGGGDRSDGGTNHHPCLAQSASRPLLQLATPGRASTQRKTRALRSPGKHQACRSLSRH